MMFCNVVCLNGHSWQVHENSPLGERARKREARGLLDALPLPCTECDECNEGLSRANEGWDDELTTQSFEDGLETRSSWM